MYQTHVRLDDDLGDAVKAYADRYGISVADAIRILLRHGLDGKQAP